MHCNSSKVAAHALAFPCVQAAAYFKAERAYCVADRAGTADRSRWPIEGDEQTVTRSVYLASAVLLQHIANFGIECLERRAGGDYSVDLASHVQAARRPGRN